MTDKPRATPASPQTLTTLKRAAVRALRQAQSRIERGEWADSISLIGDAHSFAAQCADQESRIND